MQSAIHDNYINQKQTINLISTCFFESRALINSEVQLKIMKEQRATLKNF